MRDRPYQVFPFSANMSCLGFEVGNCLLAKGSKACLIAATEPRSRRRHIAGQVISVKSEQNFGIPPCGTAGKLLPEIPPERLSRDAERRGDLAFGEPCRAQDFNLLALLGRWIECWASACFRHFAILV